MKRMKYAMGLVLLVTGITLADGDARKSTKTEQDFTIKVMQTLDKAMPGIPTGWSVSERSAVKAEEYVPKGCENQPMILFYHLAMEDSIKLAAADAATQQAILEVAANNRDHLSGDGYAKNLAQMEAIGKKLEAAINKGDMAKVQELQKELENAQAPIAENGEKIENELQEKTRPLAARDARCMIKVIINSENQSLEDCTPLTDIAGRPTYWQAYSEGLNDRYEGECKAFIGAWKPAKDSDQRQMLTSANLALPHTVVQNVMVSIAGDRVRCQKILAGLNWTLIKTLLPTK